MKKILKIISMLFVIAAVVFAASCTEEAEPAEDVTENNTAENNTTEVNETAETGLLVTEADNGTSISLKNGREFYPSTLGKPVHRLLLATQPGVRGLVFSMTIIPRTRILKVL